MMSIPVSPTKYRLEAYDYDWIYKRFSENTPRIEKAIHLKDNYSRLVFSKAKQHYPHGYGKIDAYLVNGRIYTDGSCVLSLYVNQLTKDGFDVYVFEGWFKDKVGIKCKICKDEGYYMTGKYKVKCKCMMNNNQPINPNQT